MYSLNKSDDFGWTHVRSKVPNSQRFSEKQKNDAIRNDQINADVLKMYSDNMRQAPTPLPTKKVSKLPPLSDSKATVEEEVFKVATITQAKSQSLQNMRTRKGLSRKALGILINTNEKTVKSYENGNVPYNHNLYHKMIATLKGLPDKVMDD